MACKQWHLILLLKNVINLVFISSGILDLRLLLPASILDWHAAELCPEKGHLHRYHQFWLWGKFWLAHILLSFRSLQADMFFYHMLGCEYHLFMQKRKCKDNKNGHFTIGYWYDFISIPFPYKIYTWKYSFPSGISCAVNISIRNCWQCMPTELTTCHIPMVYLIYSAICVKVNAFVDCLPHLDQVTTYDMGSVHKQMI